MQNYCLGTNYKDKQKITYFLISCKFRSVIFLVLLCVFSIFTFILLSILHSDTIFVLMTTGQRQIKRDKKLFCGTKKITGHIVFMSPCHRPDKGTSMWYMRLFCHTTVSWSKQGTKPSIFGFEWLPVNTVLPLLSLQSLEVKIRLNYPFFYFGQEIIPDVFFFTSMWRLISPARRHLHNWKIEG